MKKVFLHCVAPVACLLALFLSSAFQLSSDSLNGESAAHFDYFTYIGSDDYYKQHPLTAPDQFYNPILPGWYSDPSICSNGDDYFLTTSTFSYFPGVPIFHSKDMINWKQVGHVLNRPSQLKLEGQRVSEGIFAPAISYNPHNKTYYMITTNIRGGNFFVKTKDPFGSWSDPIWLPEVQGIDPSFFFDTDGSAYIINNDAPDGPVLYDGHRAIRIQQFDVVTDKTFGPRKMLVNGGVNLNEKPVWIEGPHIYKINGRYLLMAAEGGTGSNHREVIFYSDKPMGDYTPWSKNPILTQKHLDPNRIEPITCAGHADLIQNKKGEWWSVFLACRPIENQFENLGRETFLMPVRWSADGFPYMTTGTEVVPRILAMKGVKRDASTTYGNFEITDQFDKPKLGLEWMTLRGPADSLYSVTDKPGFITVKCADVQSTERKEIAYVSRRIQHHKFEVVTSVLFDPRDENEAAGLLLLKDEKHQYFLSIRKNSDGKKIAVEKISAEGSEVINSLSMPASATPLKLRVTSNGKTFSFYVSGDNNAWRAVAEGVDARYLSTANSFGFTGTNIGLYATSASYNTNSKSNQP